MHLQKRSLKNYFSNKILKTFNGLYDFEHKLQGFQKNDLRCLIVNACSCYGARQLTTNNENFGLDIGLGFAK